MSHSGTRSCAALGLLSALLLSGCPHRPTDNYAALLATRQQAYLSGHITGASELANLHKRDFVYGIAVGPASQTVAFTHLAAKVYRLDLLHGTPDFLRAPEPVPVADAEICPNEFDAEGLAISPDGKHFAVASRDAEVRVFDAAGKLEGSFATEEPLAAAAWSPDGRYLAVGSEGGLITVLATPGLTYGSEVRAHANHLRALAFADDGTLWSGGWDKVVRSFALTTAAVPVTEARLHVKKLGGLSTVHAMIDGKASVALTIDERSPQVTLSPEAAQRAGIDVTFLKDRIQQLSPAGMVELPVARDRTIAFKNLVLAHVDIAICQSCQPPGVDGVLGADFAARHTVVHDEATDELVIRLRDPSQAQTLELPVLTPRARFQLPGFVEDLTVDRQGDKLGVALDEDRPERSLALYKREKAGTVEEKKPGNVAVILDARTGQVLERHAPHFGVVSTAGISPDGRSLASGGWDRHVYLFSGGDTPVAQMSYGWAVRKARFSPDGRLLAIGAWTPQNAQDADSDPSAQLFSLTYADPQVALAP